MTGAERKLWRHLRTLEVAGSHFRRQATIGPYYADFACHAARLIIEVDGGGHAEERQSSADAARTAFLNARGYRVLRFWNNDVFGDTEAVFTAIADALKNVQPPTPDPSPPRASRAGGGEPEPGP
jgi:very-short-patch-repair endonuclease